MPSRMLSRIESHLVLLAINQRESTREAADVAFNHAIRPIVETANVKPGTVPDIHARDDGLMELIWEETSPVFDENGMGPREARIFSQRMKLVEEESDASSG